jgi:DNA-binding transcriptional LysR family regulator
MDVKHLKAFHEAEKAKSFILAARRMYVSRLTFGTRVKSVERRFAGLPIQRNEKTFELPRAPAMVSR